MACKPIDMTAHPRKAHFDYFRALSYPYVGVTAQVDVTDLAAFCRRKGCSFYLTMLHAAALAADAVPEMRRRIREGGVVEYDACPTSHTELMADGSYAYCTVRHRLPFDEYIREAEAARRRCRENPSIEEDEDAESMYFVSTLPWVHYTALIQPVAAGDESNPRITWGQYAPDAAGRLMLPMSILAHHALVDGLHIGQFYQALTKALAEIVRTP